MLHYICAYVERSLLKNGFPGTAVLDSIVFDKVREATGGQLRIAMSGGAPLAKQTQEFLGMVLCPLINGYGMTETSGMGLLGDPLGWTVDAHGEPPCGVEIKLVDYPEAGYFATNKKPQGEIWIRGPPIMKRYFERPDLTDEAFGPDQWLKTGDIGQWEKNGQLTIIDRKKNLIKTLNGEYIAIEKVWLQSSSRCYAYTS
jgi:long-chain acyl-CoA synthetase